MMTEATRTGSHNSLRVVRGAYTRQWALAICVGPEVTGEATQWWYYRARFVSRREAQAAKYSFLDRYAGKGSLSISRMVIRSPHWDRRMVV